MLHDCIRPFGQRQELVHRLKNVLNDYPPTSLIAEMLQNAGTSFTESEGLKIALTRTAQTTQVPRSSR